MNGDAESSVVPAYVLGHSRRELTRLTVQARLINPITRRFFQDAGVGPGMRVLDVGTDLSQAAIETARERAAGLPHVTFIEGDPARIAFEEAFDAVMGRYVLQFLSEPADMLRRLAHHLKPGGLMVWHELDWDGTRSSPPAPTYDLCCRWVVQSLRASGHSANIGPRLHETFVAAGFPEPNLRLESAIGAGAGAEACLALVSDLMPILLPVMERHGIATAEEVGLETLSVRLQAEAAAGSVIIGRSEIGAWARKREHHRI